MTGEDAFNWNYGISLAKTGLQGCRALVGCSEMSLEGRFHICVLVKRNATFGM